MRVLPYVGVGLRADPVLRRKRNVETVSPAGEVLSREGKYPKFPGPAGPDPWRAIKFCSADLSALVVDESFPFSIRCRWVDFCRNRLILPADRASVCSIAGVAKR